jgi:hypothetical protein
MALLLTLALSAAVAADSSSQPDVETLMTPEDYAASGLEKLSDTEREHLSEWVERYREGAVLGPLVHKKPSLMTEEEKVEYKQIEEVVNADIVAKVIPAFIGWNGKTVFRLDNGQTWRQRTAGKLRYSGSDSTVTITRNKLGKYKMKHEDTGRSVGVKRID